MTQTISRVPLYEQMVEMISNLIIEGKYKVGDQLPTESDLAEKYNVSRTVVREAMKALKEKGMVETKVAKGTFVTYNLEKGIGDSIEMMIRGLPEESLWNIIEIRKSFEPEISAIAARKAKIEDTQKLKETIDAMGKIVHEKKENDIRKTKEQMRYFSKLDFQFHKELIDATQNSLLILLMSSLFGQIELQQLSHASIKAEACQNSYNEHLQIYNAVVDGDPQKAREAMRKHISTVEQDFIQISKN